MKKTRADIDRAYLARIKTPLVFGDSEQLRLLRDWLVDIAEFEARNDPSKPLREWRVGYSYRVEDEEIVEAHSREEAEEIAEMDYNGGDDFAIEYCELIESERPIQKTPERKEDDNLWLNLEKMEKN